MKDIEWFKQIISPVLDGYELSYRFFPEGDFGSLHQVEFNSDRVGGNVDFWGLGWLGIFVWDYKKEQQLLNILLEPQEEMEKEKAFEKLLELLRAS